MINSQIRQSGCPWASSTALYSSHWIQNETEYNATTTTKSGWATMMMMISRWSEIKCVIEIFAVNHLCWLRTIWCWSWVGGCTECLHIVRGRGYYIAPYIRFAGSLNNYWAAINSIYDRINLFLIRIFVVLWTCFLQWNTWTLLRNQRITKQTMLNIKRNRERRICDVDDDDDNTDV